MPLSAYAFVTRFCNPFERGTGLVNGYNFPYAFPFTGTLLNLLSTRFGNSAGFAFLTFGSVRPQHKYTHGPPHTFSVWGGSFFAPARWRNTLQVSPWGGSHGLTSQPFGQSPQTKEMD